MRFVLPLVVAASLISLPAITAAQTAASKPQAGAARHPADEPGRGDANDAQHAPDFRADLARSEKVTDADIATAPVHEVRKVSHHTVTIGGRPIAYTATAGALTIRDDEGKPTASMFYVAYTTGGEHRPVTFFYNGGPGSSTLWLHMGSLAPVRVRTDSPQSTHNAPFDLIPNSDSLLDKSDLVFIDAIGAGYSRPLGDTKLQAFWGTDPDIDAFARGIERYLTANDRWNSPKFIFGESYGTTRSAGLAYRLQSDGVQLNGVVLLSSILNYGRRGPGLDQDMINYLPSYAATAAYHHKLPTQPADIMAFLREVREWARGPYAGALAKGQDISPAEKQAIAHQLSAYTGLSETFLIEADLRVNLQRFLKELERDQRRTLGRYDSRFEGIDTDAAGEGPEFDPSDTGITGAFVGAFHTYLARDLGYETNLTYRPTYYSAGTQWDFKHKAPNSRGFGGTNEADVALDLSQAMRENPHLLVYSLNGIYDMATPFFGTEYDLNHMQLDPSLHANLRFAYYPSGHMVYLNTDALKSMKADLARFYDEATAR
jgi:carboxypeptidase C (cathepsin A)